MQSFVPRDTFALKIQRELCNPKCAQKVSGLSRNGPLMFIACHPYIVTCKSFKLISALKPSQWQANKSSTMHITRLIQWAIKHLQ